MLMWRGSSGGIMRKGKREFKALNTQKRHRNYCSVAWQFQRPRSFKVYLLPSTIRGRGESIGERAIRFAAKRGPLTDCSGRGPALVGLARTNLSKVDRNSSVSSMAMWNSRLG